MTGPSLPEGPIQFVDVASGLTVPLALQAGIGRHRAHLTQLTASMRAAGLPEAQITASIEALTASYRTELIRALNALKESDHDARSAD